MIFGTRAERGDQLKGLYEVLGEKRVLFLDGIIVPSHDDPQQHYSRQDIFNAPVLADIIMALNIKSNDPIWLVINSNGGDIEQGLVLYDAIRTSNAPVYTVGRICFSMAAFLLAAGEKGHRYVFQNNLTMIHFPFIGSSTGGNVNELNKLTDDLRKTTNMLIDTLIENGVKKTKKSIEKDLVKEVLLNAQETIDYGMADKIVDKEVMKQILGNHV